MKCPYCSFEDTKVVESRCADDGLKVRRRRECENCSKRFTTYEIIEQSPIIIIKRGGSRQKFDRKKLLEGIFKACEKRPISMAEIEKIVQDIENTIQNSFDREVPSSLIGDICMEELRKKDEVAYIRFASVYRQFKDVKAFMEELKNFLDERN